MIKTANIVKKAGQLHEGEVAYLAWQRGLPDVRSLYAELSKALPERTFEVHETINGYTIKSI